MSEKLVTSELRRFILLLNGQCTSFFNSYLCNIKTCVERTNLDLTLPGQLNSPYGNAPEGEAASHKPPSRIQGDFDGTNLLYTICEQTEIGNTFANDSLTTSTPLPDNYQPLRQIQNLPRSPGHLAPLVYSPPMPSTSGFNKTPRRPFRLSSRRLSNEVITESDEQERSSRDDSTDINVKECVVKVKRLDAKTIELIQSSPVDRAREISVASSGPSTTVTRQTSVESNATSLASTVQESSPEGSTASSPIKRRVKVKKEIKPRRSGGRPKRKATRVIGSLAEASVKKKLRRSK